MRASTIDTIRSLGWTAVAFGSAILAAGLIVLALTVMGDDWPMEMWLALIVVGGAGVAPGCLMIWWTGQATRQARGFTPDPPRSDDIPRA